ncbi:hypothetical protein CEXT_385511 [Caerostris extrusa]|uniref:Uncharacterized protein n=1 Tax=Caerostris extrusa TaxID=172846 RepID=A0AAV4RFA7_CAEEX|nr:hypothetical protein CEXT_385511 [Caerostris extrusa]
MTAAGLLTTAIQELKKSCVFCGGKQYSSLDCFSVQRMGLAESKNSLKEKVFASFWTPSPILSCIFKVRHLWGNTCAFNVRSSRLKNKETQKKDEVKVPEK